MFKNIFFQSYEQEFIRLVQQGQSPKTLFIGCSDSRVIPELLLQAKPGDLFVIRTAGNFVPVYDTAISWDGVAATIEYAVEALGIVDIIVCGHSHCGAITALFAEPDATKPPLELVPRWLRFGQEAKDAVEHRFADNMTTTERIRATEYLSILYQVQHLLSFPFISRKVAAGAIHLHGWHFCVEKGDLSYYNPHLEQFTPLQQLL
jgi:carbonic anhydrase